MVDIAEIQRRARELALGAQFKPRQEEIETPKILLEKMPELANMLKLVGMSAEALIQMRQGAGDDSALLTALYVCHALRFRDSGGPDNAGTPYFAMSDAKALVQQDYDLLNELGLIVRQFLGLIPKRVDDAKNDSKATTNSDGGSESPENSAEPSTNVNEPSTSENSMSGSPS